MEVVREETSDAERPRSPYPRGPGPLRVSSSAGFSGCALLRFLLRQQEAEGDPEERSSERATPKSLRARQTRERDRPDRSVLRALPRPQSRSPEHGLRFGADLNGGSESNTALLCYCVDRLRTHAC